MVKCGFVAVQIGTVVLWIVVCGTDRTVKSGFVGVQFGTELLVKCSV